jgi:hypothetical protein
MAGRGVHINPIDYRTIGRICPLISIYRQLLLYRVAFI